MASCRPSGASSTRGRGSSQPWERRWWLAATLTWDETYQKRPVAIISENFAREYWGSPTAALGKKIRVGTTDDWRESSA